jgi:lipopolysaccharide export system protein LptA
MKLKILLLLLVFAYSSAATADTNDLTIKSTNQDMNYKVNTMYFSGDVIVNQGKLTIRADELFVETNDDGTSEKLIAKGNPASFTQQSKTNTAETISATANEVVYIVDAQTLTLTGAASYQQGGSKVTGKNIVFDLKEQRVKAEGGEGKDERVVTRLKTKK